MKEEVVVKSKEIVYRGKNLEELKKMDVRESAKYLSARNRRTVLRRFDAIEKFVKRCGDKLKKNKKIKTHLRDMIVVPKLVGIDIYVHNGKNFNNVKITPEMIGHRLGEFSFTRGRVVHGNPGIGSTKSSAAEKK